MSPLQAASTSGCEMLVRHLLQSGASPNGLPDESGCPIQAAAERGECNTIQILLEAGADVNGRCGYYSESALVAACNGGYDDAAAILLRAGTNLRDGVARLETSLKAAAAWGESADLIDRLISAGADVPGYYHTALLEAARDDFMSKEQTHERSETGLELLMAKVALAASTSSKGSDLNKVISYAALLGRARMVEIVSEACRETFTKSLIPKDGLSQSLLRDDGALRQWLETTVTADVPGDLMLARNQLRALQILLEEDIDVHEYSVVKSAVFEAIAHLSILNQEELDMAKESAEDLESRRLDQPNIRDGIAIGLDEFRPNVVTPLRPVQQIGPELRLITSSERDASRRFPPGIFVGRNDGIEGTLQTSLSASSSPTMPKKPLPTRIIPNIHLIHAALRIHDFAMLNRLSAQYFECLIDAQPNLRIWWQELLDLLPETQLVKAIEAIPRSNEHFKVWEMAFHGAFVLANFGMSNSLPQQCERPGAMQQDWHSGQFVPLLSNRPQRKHTNVRTRPSLSYRQW
ncbi:hypothetical protein TI39_contig840g00002 [Zymoseptoria brevis]|uniref:Uncharacterized protein n=1 Tax=Zymoseptoria brevis TaxID=1047168 RepID=A0A0F4GIR9_9PEZI|nr:hypothetical protein TI39_contig840g00002 [Zymoseptoria brevis]